MEKDFCVKCGSENLKDKVKDIELDLRNPGKITIPQKCNECQECGEIYFKKKQLREFSRKLNEAAKKTRK